MKQSGLYLASHEKAELQRALQSKHFSSYHQRISIMILADQGKSQLEICSILGCCSATASHWMHIVKIGMSSEWKERPIGRPKVVKGEYIDRLQELLSNSPKIHGYSFDRWTLAYISKHLSKELGVVVSDRHLKRLLKKLGISTKSAPVSSGKSNQRINIADLNPGTVISKPQTIRDDIPKSFLGVNFNGSKIIRCLSYRAISYQSVWPSTEFSRNSAVS